MELSQSRPPFTLKDRLRLNVAILVIPKFTILIFWVCCYFSVLLSKNYSYPWILFLIGMRYIPFAIELGILEESISQAEFDSWVSNLYSDRVGISSTAFYVHCRPTITIGTLVLSGSLVPLSLLLHNGNDIWILVLQCVEIELGVLLFRWLLELYAHAPAKINILLAVASVSMSKQQVMPYYDMFYAPSRLTISLGCLVLRARRHLEQRRTLRSRAADERVLEEGDNESSSAPSREAEEQPEQSQPSLGSEISGINKGKQVVQEPWQKDPVGIYTSNIQQRVRKFHQMDFSKFLKLQTDSRHPEQWPQCRTYRSSRPTSLPPRTPLQPILPPHRFLGSVGLNLSSRAYRNPSYLSRYIRFYPSHLDAS
jgi:hypothetical protein